VPAAENVAVVVNAVGLPKVTVPGPLTPLHCAVRVPFGKPSSVAVPVRFAQAGNVIVWLAPALTTGGWLTARGGSTEMIASSLAESWPSLAVSRNV